MRQDGQVGARTMFDIPPAMLSPLSAEELRAHLM
jgi:diaminopimelate dehydrogenase